jgi:integrase
MALFKRGKVWWARFTVHGQRYRKSLETCKKRDAIDEERKQIAQAGKGILSTSVTDFARFTFGKALEIYLADRETSVSPRTKKPLAEKTKTTEAERAVILTARLGVLPVKKFTPDLVHAYIQVRLKEVSHGTINRELDLIRGVLRRANLWARMADQVKALPPGESIGRALSEEEKARIAETASLKAGWRNARLAYILSLNTTMRPAEMKALRWGDVDWSQRTLTLRKSKTDAGKRTIPLNDEAFAAIRELQTGAKALFGDFLRADWFIFAVKIPTESVKAWRTAWKNMLETAKVPHTRFYNTRHTAITDLLQNPAASEETVKAIAGHVSRKMLERYSHTRIEAKRKAVEALTRKSSGTNLAQSAPTTASSER